MKNLSYFLSVIGFIFFSCSNDDIALSTELVGKWELIELFADPGDGNTEFFSVESKKTLTFKKNGTLISNGNLCSMSVDSDNSSSGSYSASESTFTSPECPDPDYNYSFEQNGDILIIDYPCIEPCRAKYKKE